MKRAKLLWIDLEMTGLDPEKDRILEVAAIATSWDLEPIKNYEGIVRVDDEIIASRMVGEFLEKNAESYTKCKRQTYSRSRAGSSPFPR